MIRRLAILWPCLGPYHVARLEAAAALLAPRGGSVTGIEVASMDRMYAWVGEGRPPEFRRLTLFPDVPYQDLDRHRIARAVKRALDDLRPDAVAVAGWRLPEARAAHRWCLRRGTTSVLMSESKQDDYPRRWWKESIKRRILRKIDAALVGGTPQAEYVIRLGMPPARVFKGYDVVDNARFAIQSDAARRRAAEWRARLALPERYFIAVARFVKTKNLDGLLESYRLYREGERHPWSLVLCGSGPLESDLKTLCRSRRIDEVRWPGFQQIDTLPAFYGLASAFVIASTLEPWGLVVNEAMASALPILVSSRVGCARDLLREGANGFAFEPEDSVRLAARMRQMAHLGDDDRRRMGESSRSIISRWGPDRFASMLWAAVQSARDSGLAAQARAQSPSAAQAPGTPEHPVATRSP